MFNEKNLFAKSLHICQNCRWNLQILKNMFFGLTTIANLHNSHNGVEISVSQYMWHCTTWQSSPNLRWNAHISFSVHADSVNMFVLIQARCEHDKYHFLLITEYSLVYELGCQAGFSLINLVNYINHKMLDYCMCKTYIRAWHPSTYTN